MVLFTPPFSSHVLLDVSSNNIRSIHVCDLREPSIRVYARQKGSRRNYDHYVRAHLSRRHRESLLQPLLSTATKSVHVKLCYRLILRYRLDHLANLHSNGSYARL